MLWRPWHSYTVPFPAAAPLLCSRPTVTCAGTSSARVSPAGGLLPTRSARCGPAPHRSTAAAAPAAEPRAVRTVCRNRGGAGPLVPAGRAAGGHTGSRRSLAGFVTCTPGSWLWVRLRGAGTAGRCGHRVTWRLARDSGYLGRVISTGVRVSCRLLAQVSVVTPASRLRSSQKQDVLDEAAAFLTDSLSIRFCKCSYSS